MPGPEAAILILNWNGRRWLAPCIESVLDQEGPEREVWLVDNGSVDGSLAFVEQRYPTVRRLGLGANLGFGAAYNRAIDLVTTPKVILLNNDTVTQPGWLTALLACAEDYPEAAAISSKLLYLDRPSLINHAGARMTPLGAAYDIGLNCADGPHFQRPMIVGCASGAAVLLRRDAFFEAGRFDERYFAYFEDADLCWRFWLSGYTVRFEPRARVLHAYGGSTSGGRLSTFRIQHCQTNRLQNMLKHLELETLATALPMSVAYDALRLAQLKRARQPDAARALAAGTRAFRAMLPAVLHERTARPRRRSDRELRSLNVIASMLDAAREWRRLGGLAEVADRRE